MRKLLNALYVSSQGSYLSKDGACLVVKTEEGKKTHVPIGALESVVLFGQIGASPFALGHCAEHGVCLSWFTEYGRFLARLEGPVSGNVLLRRAQYRAADDPTNSADLARFIVTGKVANQRTVLRRALRDHGDAVTAEDRARLEAAVQRLNVGLAALPREGTVDGVRGLEGEAAQVYFGCFGAMIRQDGDGAFALTGRSRRPPLDPTNSLLSFVYALLTHDVRGALEANGLDPQVGFLHRERPGRPSLALDLVEEFRAFFADRLVLSLINRKQVAPSGFATDAAGAVTMTEETRKAVLVAYQTRKKEEVTHPFLGEKVPIGLLPHVQAQLMARHLRGDLDGYPPFLWR